MKRPSKEEMAKSMASFIDFDIPSVTILDRSTLEAWGQCPFRASCLDRKLIDFPAVLHIGEEVHQAISRATHQWIESDGQLSPGELRDALIAELRGSRPDVQPQVLSACAASAWNWAAYLAANCHPGNILGFDGGDDLEKSGQLAADFEDLNARITSELDLLVSTDSPELVKVIDYKSGHKIHTAADAANSFQSHCHAFLVFLNYPDVRGVEYEFWNTASNRRTYKVTLDRKRMGDYSARMRMAVQSWATNQEERPCWPSWEKCSGCEAAALCPVSGQDIGDVARDPAAALNHLIAIEAKADALRKTLAAYVDSRGQEIQAGGVAFGRNKPPSGRKPTATVYEVKQSAEDSECAA